MIIKKVIGVIAISILLQVMGCCSSNNLETVIVEQKSEILALERKVAEQEADIMALDKQEFTISEKDAVIEVLQQQRSAEENEIMTNKHPVSEPFCTEIFYFTDEETQEMLENELILEEQLYFEDKLFATFRIEFPQFSTITDFDPVNRINSYYQNLFDDYQIRVYQHIEKLKAGWEWLEPFSSHYYLDISFNVKVTMRYITVLRYIGEYFGWLHPQSWVSADTFDKATGNKLSLSELFTVDESIYLQRLTDEIYKAFLKIPGYEVKYSINGSYEEEREQTHNLCANAIRDDCFYLDEDGIVLLFNNYSIACYTAGPTWVKIPYACISDIFKF